MKKYDQLVRECAEQGKALARMMANDGTLEPLYLYSRASTETTDGALFLVRDSAPVPPGVELVTGEGLRGNVSYTEYFQWVYDRARWSPILCWGKVSA